MFAISERHRTIDSSAHAQSVSIIVPTLNEEENNRASGVANYCVRVPFSEILFVDDRSTDATRAEIRALERSHPIRLIDQDGADVGLAGAIMYRCEGRGRRNSSRDGRGI